MQLIYINLTDMFDLSFWVGKYVTMNIVGNVLWAARSAYFVKINMNCICLILSAKILEKLVIMQK